MEKRIGIFYGEVNLIEEAQTTCAALRKSFIGIETIMLSVLEVPETAFDNSTGYYDAQGLLNNLALPSDVDIVIWIVEKKIGSFWQPLLFGAAGDLRAVVSAAALESADLVAKVACHETGHLLGLSHCREHCCMRHSSSLVDLQRKPDTLCKKCLSQLQAV